jgi:hypothetical protein
VGIMAADNRQGFGTSRWRLWERCYVRGRALGKGYSNDLVGTLLTYGNADLHVRS